MTTADIQADVASALGMTISATSRITSTEVLRWINEDYRTAQSKMADANINYYQGETQDYDTTVTGTYTLPTGFLAMKRLEIQYNDDEDKARATPIDINDIYSTLNPDGNPWSQKSPFYAIWENTFLIRPIPDEISSTWTVDDGSAMIMWFVELQDDLSGVVVPSLPSSYHHILSYGAIAKGFRKLRKFTEAGQYEALLRTGFAEMVAENTYKDKTKPMGFTVVRGGNKRFGIWKS